MPLMTNYQAKYMCGNSKAFLKREKVIFFNKMRARKTNLMSLSIKTSHFLCLLTKLNELMKSKADSLYTLPNVKCIEYIQNICDSNSSQNAHSISIIKLQYKIHHILMEHPVHTSLLSVSTKYVIG